MTKYYYLGSQRIAVRKNGVLNYLHGDHLGSASLATDANGQAVPSSRAGYFPYGGTRYGGSGLPTDRQFTGQRAEASLGFYDYVARQFDPALGRFLQADSIIPQPANPQSLNRYAYTLNNPLRYTDPSGHFTNDQIQQAFGVKSWDEVLALFKPGGMWELNWAWLDVLHQASHGDMIRSYFTFKGGGTPVSVGGVMVSGPPQSDFIREGLFRLTDNGEIFIDLTSNSCVNSGLGSIPITAFALGVENSYELFAQYEYYGDTYNQRRPHAEGGQWLQRGRAWGGYQRWKADIDWAGLGLDVVGGIGAAWSPALAIGWAATGLNVARYQPDLRAGDREARIDLALDIIGAAPYIGVVANAYSAYRDLGIYDSATHGRRY